MGCNRKTIKPIGEIKIKDMQEVIGYGYYAIIILSLIVAGVIVIKNGVR